MNVHEKQSRLLRALSHPVRLQIAEILSQEEACVCHLEARLRQRQAYVSQQLGVLRNAGLVTERRVGTFVYHRLADPGLAEFLAALRRLTDAPVPDLTSPIPASCGCPRCELSRQPVSRRRPSRKRLNVRIPAVHR